MDWPLEESWPRLNDPSDFANTLIRAILSASEEGA
jgi:hypothetical protein